MVESLSNPVRLLSAALVATAVHCSCELDALPATTVATAAGQLAELWQEPQDVPKQDLYFGPWGADHAPDPRATYTFVKPKTHGASSGMIVVDRAGRRWHVKQGREAAPEVVVSRVLSAVGYHQPPVYFLASFTLADSHRTTLARGGRFRSTTGVMKGRGEWSWYDNPFLGARSLRGLLVVLVMLNSADLKNSNNTVYDLETPNGGVTRWFVVRDLGTSFGAVGRLNPKPNDVGVFERQRFITGVADGFVTFDYHGVHSDLIKRTITPDDVRWASRLLARIGDAPWLDAFRAGGYAPGVAARFVRRLREKIAEGMLL